MCILQLSFLFNRLHGVAKGAPRYPFILLAITIFTLGVGYIFLAIYTRWYSDVLMRSTLRILDALEAVYLFFYYTSTTFLPAVCLQLMHVRGSILRASQGTTFNPLMSRKWKKLFDWALIVLLYILSIASFSLYARANVAYRNGEIDVLTYSDRINERIKVNDAAIVFKLLAYLDVIVSSIIMFVQARKHNTGDPVRPHL
jgi:hypothetical protein